MARERMTVARLARDLKALSDQVAVNFEQVNQRFEQVNQRFEQVDQRFEQVDQRFEQVDQRFEQVDRRFEQVDQQFVQLRQDLENFATRIELSFKMSLEGMESKLNAALDGTREQKRRLDDFARTNAHEHRLMQAQIDDLDAKLQAPRRSRRRSS